MTLRKLFPKDRNYEIWNILMCYFIHMDVSLPEKDRTLFGNLAYRLISKAAESVPVDKVRAISRLLRLDFAHNLPPDATSQ